MIVVIPVVSDDSPPKKTKKQHFVPEMYLKRFTTGSRLWVFDKVNLKSFPSNPSDVANANYFYDLPQELVDLGFDEQGVEKGLSAVEGNLSPALDELCELAERLPEDRYYTTEKVLSDSLRSKISFFMALQFVRSRDFRTGYMQLTDQLIEWSNKIIGKVIPERSSDKKAEAAAHAGFMMNGRLPELAQAMLRHCCFLGLNRSGTPLYTSDAPLLRIPHSKDPVVGGRGMISQGIELVLPVSPRVAVLMYEPTFHKQKTEGWDGTIREIREESVIYLNAHQVLYSERQVFCSQERFDLAIEVCKKHPEVRNPKRPRIRIN